MFQRKKKRDLFAPPSDEVGKRFAKASAHYLLKQEQWEKSLGDVQALPWSFDQDDGLLVFEMPDGSLRTFEAEVLGSYLDRAKEWEWAWNNPNVSPQMSKKASELRDYGRQHNVPFLVEGHFELPNEDTFVFLLSICVGMTDVLAHYIGDAGDVSVVLAVCTERSKSVPIA